ncbi:MAG: hypothetical protein KF683_19335 [Rubrivivax sp.]|nr:hypothetical protein [Rubrivivax sp.]
MASISPSVPMLRNAAHDIRWTVNGASYRAAEIQIQYGPDGMYAQPGSFDPATERYQIFNWAPGGSRSGAGNMLFAMVPPELGPHTLTNSGERGATYVTICAENDPTIGCAVLVGTVTVERVHLVGDTSIPRRPAVVDMSINLEGSRVEKRNFLGELMGSYPVSGRIEVCVDEEHSSTGCQQLSGGRLVTGKDRGETGDGGGGGGSGGGGSAGCSSEFTIDRLKGYYSAATLTAPKRVAANTRLVSADNGDPAIVLESTERIEGQTRYVTQIVVPSARFAAGTTSFAVGQAIGVLVYSIGTDTRGNNVADSFRTNRDWGRAQASVGTLTIESTSPQLRGSFQFQASGDGYPSLNDFFATVSGGRFCMNR